MKRPVVTTAREYANPHVRDVIAVLVAWQSKRVTEAARKGRFEDILGLPRNTTPAQCLTPPFEPFFLGPEHDSGYRPAYWGTTREEKAGPDRLTEPDQMAESHF